MTCWRRNVGVVLIIALMCIYSEGRRSNAPLIESKLADAKIIATAKHGDNIQPQATTILPKTNAKIMLTLASITYGSNYVFTKHQQEAFHPSIVTFVRFLISSFVFAKDIVCFRGNIQVILGSLEIGLWCGIGFIAQALALQRTTASKASFFGGLAVLMPPIFDMIWNRIVAPPSSIEQVEIEGKFKLNPLIAPLLALCGASILEWGGFEPPKLDDLFLLITPFCFGMCFWRSETHAKRFPEHINVNAGILTLTTCLISYLWTLQSGALSTISSLLELSKTLARDKMMAFGFLYSGLLATAWTGLVEQQALEVLSASEVTLTYAMEPIFASIFAVAFLHEHIGLPFLVGGALIFLATSLDVVAQYIAAQLQRFNIVGPKKIKGR